MPAVGVHIGVGRRRRPVLPPFLIPLGVLLSSWEALDVWNLFRPSNCGSRWVGAYKIPGVDALPAGCTWTAATKRLHIGTAGTVLEGWRIEGWVSVGAANCEVRDNLFYGVADGVVADFAWAVDVGLSGTALNASVHHNDFDGLKLKNPTAAAISNRAGNNGLLAEYNRITGMGADCLQHSADAIFRWNDLTAGGWSTGAHADGIQSMGGSLLARFNRFDMTPRGQPAGRINTAIFPSAAGGLGPITICNNIILGYLTLPSLPINIGNAYAADIFDNLVTLNSGLNWRYPTGQGFITRSDGNKELYLGLPLSEYTVQLDADAVAFFARLAAKGVSLTSAQKRTYHDLIAAHKAGGSWALLDAIYALRTVSELAARENLKQDAFHLTKTGSFTFTPFVGVNIPILNQFYDTGYNPTTASGAQWTKDSMAMGGQVDPAPAIEGAARGVLYQSAGASIAIVATGEMTSRANSSSNVQTAGTDIFNTDGNYSVSRTGSAGYVAGHTGAEEALTRGSIAVTSGTLRIGGQTTQGTNRTHYHAWLGGGLTDPQLEAIAAAQLAFNGKMAA